MSKKTQKNITYNPEKHVPDDIREQFFSAIRTGDLDKIREFANKYKNQYHLVEKTGTAGKEFRKTPFHVVLELDEKIASNHTKLLIMKYLDQMGSPMDLPDSADIWPIHLAAALQSEKIIDFLLEKNVAVNRKDSSNNMPIHYAIIGKEILCPRGAIIGSLIPAQKESIETQNKALEKAYGELIKLISNNKKINGDLIHMINTIMKIPDFFVDDNLSISIQKEILNTLSETALSSTIHTKTSGTPSIIGTTEQNKIEQLIEKNYSAIIDKLFGDLMDPLDISPGNGGWGPKIKTGPGSSRPPNNLERIMKYELHDIIKEAEKRYTSTRNAILSDNALSINILVNNIIPNILYIIDIDYIDKLVFCSNCNEIDYGEEVFLTKMFYILSFNHYKLHYSEYLADTIMDNLKLMSKTQYINMIDYPNAGIIPKDLNEYIYYSSLGNLLSSNTIPKDNIIRHIINIANWVPNRYSESYSFALDKMFYDGYFRRPTDKANTEQLLMVNTVLSLPVKKMLQLEYMEQHNDLFEKMEEKYKSPKNNWFEILKSLIKEIKPTINNTAYSLSQDPLNRINYFLFYDPVNNIYYYDIPLYPLPNRIDNIYLNRITYEYQHGFIEMFRILSEIANYLRYNNFVSYGYPEIFDVKINKWMNWVDENISNILIKTNVVKGTIIELYPHFIFLFKTFITLAQKYIKDILVSSIKGLFEYTDTLEIPTGNPIDDSIEIVKNFLTHFKEVTTYYISIPFPKNIIDEIPNETLDILYHNLGSNSTLMAEFDKFQRINNLNSLIASLGNLLIENNLLIADIEHLDDMRRMVVMIEKDVVENLDIKPIVKNPEFRNMIRQYLVNHDVLANYNILTRYVSFNYKKKEILDSLKNREITDLFFITNIYSYYFILIKESIVKIQNLINSTNYIIMDIIAHVKKTMFYYIPQIFLPALVKQIILVIYELSKVHKKLAFASTLKSDFIEFIDMTDNKIVKIFNLGDQFTEYIDEQLKVIYENIVDVIKYHNMIVDFLNMHSSYRMINAYHSGSDSDSSIYVNNFFDKNLIHLETFPNIYDIKPNLNLLKKVLRYYRIPNITYYADSNEHARVNYDVFSAKLVTTMEDNFGYYKFDKYRNIISYTRSGLHSNSPNAGDNMQLNIVVNPNQEAPTAVLPLPPTYNIQDIPEPIPGEWLNFDTNKPENITYKDAYIAYATTKYRIKRKEAMLPSIRELIIYHFKILKQKIIQEVIQYIANIRHSGPEYPAYSKELEELYNNLPGLEGVYVDPNLNEVKAYVIIGKMMDSIINKILDYTIRQSVGIWMSEMVSQSQGSISKSIIDKVNQTIAIIGKKEYTKMSLKDISTDFIIDFSKTSKKYLDSQIPQIEPDPLNIKNTSVANARKFVHYLYNINYFSTGNVETNRKCYYINPNIVTKLITGETINAKNSDGNTPLHMAVNIGHPELVNILISRGAKAKGFKNNRNKTPYDICLTNMENHLKLTKGDKVKNIFDNFIVPFNDMLMAKLKDETYSNNIIKDISMGIPIQLVMYNHMIYNYLINYRYQFTFELKESISMLFDKYYGPGKMKLYPMDLFYVENNNQLSKIIEEENPYNRASSTINAMNKNKIEFNERKIEELNNRIYGLMKEKNKTTDKQQEIIIDQIIKNLKNEILIIEAKISSLKVIHKPSISSEYISAYMAIVDSIANKLDNRNISLVNFYQDAFDKLGKSNDFYLRIWNNYLEKNLTETFSLIFPLLDNILGQIVEACKSDNIESSHKNELLTILGFYDKIAGYIELKNKYPNNLEDNPILDEEFKQITYLINLIITPRIRNILLNYIYKALKEMDSTGNIIKDQETALNEIVNSMFSNQTIDSYLTNILPNLAIKYFTAIYMNTDDPDRSVSNAEGLFLPIIQIVKANRLISVTDNSTVVQNLRDYLIPFMVNTYQYYIYYLRLTIYGYERYLLNTYQLTKILHLLISN
jgi:ankyrin repeat protein